MSRLLAICPIGIGNFLLLAPALKHLTECKPDVRVTLLALKGGIAPVAERYPFIHDVISIDATRKTGLLGKVKSVRSLMFRFDVSAAFFPCNRREYNLLPAAAMIPRRIAFRYFQDSFRNLAWLNSTLVPVSESMHDLEQNFTILEALGVSRPEKFEMVHFPLAESECIYANNWLTERGLENELLIGFHPGSSAEHGMERKRWPIDRFASLGMKLIRDKGCRILVFGGPEEKEIKHAVTEAIGPLAVSVDTGNMFETAAIIARCNRFISNDSGLMHVAVSLGVPACGIFGPTDDKRTAPYGERNIVVRGLDDCSPCWTIRNVGTREECKTHDFRCLSELRADDVYKKIQGWL